MFHEISSVGINALDVGINALESVGKCGRLALEKTPPRKGGFSNPTQAGVGENKKCGIIPTLARGTSLRREVA